MLTLDWDAMEILRAIAPSKRRYGAVVSELLRREKLRHEVRQEVRAQLKAELAVWLSGEGEVLLER